MIALMMMLLSPTEAPVDLLDLREVVWVQLPSGESINRVFPYGRTTGARAVVECRVTPTGELERCSLVKEEPEGQGFGEAALKLTGEYRMKLETKSGVLTAGRQIQLKMSFKPAE